MTSDGSARTLPIRRWLVLALVTVFLVPACVTMGFAVAWVRGQPHNPRNDAIAYLHENTARWDDPGWQAAATTELEQDNVAFILVEGDREVYRSSTEPLLDMSGQNRTRVVERVVLPGTDPEQVAYVYVNEHLGPPDEVPIELMPIVALGALALTLAGIAWFLGQTVLKPLAATSAAARQVADGNLDVELPSSRVREVAEVNSAFESMSAELRAALQQQTEMEQERRFFIGAIVHDLRTPLFSLRGYLEGLQTGVADTPARRSHYVAVAQEKAAALERLISDLFDYTRLEYLDQKPEFEPLDLNELLRQAVESASPQAAAANMRIVFGGDRRPCIVDADNHLLNRVFENLLDNALRYTPEGGVIRLDCRRENEWVMFSVSDSGPGIPAEDLPHLFSPLFRGETSRNRRTGDAGLGLTIARRIMLAHGGDLTGSNRHAGGAIFTGFLPLERRSGKPRTK